MIKNKVGEESQSQMGVLVHLKTDVRSSYEQCK